MNPTPRPWAPAALSAVFALVLYSITLCGTFIYDDVAIIQLDNRVHDPKLWGHFWTHDWWALGGSNGNPDNLYRPLVSQSFGIEWCLLGERAWHFHFVNILLNAGVCALVGELGRRLANWRVGLIAGLLFACHPVHSEAVAGIVGRAELACAIGIISVLVLFLKSPMTYPRALAIFVFSAAAILSKEQGFVVLLLLAAMIPIRRALFGNASPAEKTPLQLAFVLVLFFTVALINLREFTLNLKFEWDRGFLDPAIQPLIQSPPLDRWIIPFALIGRYFALLVAPFKLSIDYGLDVIRPTISRSDPYLWLGFAVVFIAIVSLTAALIRHRRTIAVCLLAIILTYLPASNFLMTGGIFGERLMYIPSAFFLILVAIAIAHLPNRVQITLVAILLALGSLRTWTYIQKWNDRDTFYRYSMSRQPQSIMIRMLVSYVNYEENRLPQARQILDEVKSTNPDYFELWKRYALIDEKTGDWAAAEADWKHAFYSHHDPTLENKWANAMDMARKQHAATQTSRP